MTKLAHHLTTNGIKQEDFAASVGISQSTVSKLKNGAIKPTLDLALRIEEITGGAVTVADLAAAAKSASGAQQ